MADEFSISSNRHGEVTVLMLCGFVDAHTAPNFEDAVQQEIDTGRMRIVVDCGGLSYISSAGLGVFMGFIEEAREGNGDIKIAGGTAKVRQVFDLLGFDTIFDMTPTVEDALNRFDAGKLGPDDGET